MNSQLLSATMLVVLGTVTSLETHAATLNNGDVLTITTGVVQQDANGTDVSSGSWWAMDFYIDNAITSNEKTALSQGATGIVIGQATSPGASHLGPPTAGDTNAIDAPWLFYDNTGSHYTTVGIAGSTATGLDMSGWVWRYAAGPDVAMDSGAWTPLNAIAAGMPAAGYSNGIGLFNWDGMYGHAYTLDYTATVALSHPSGFGNVGYALHLEGTVAAAVPEATTYGMMLAGLGIVGVSVHRKKRAETC